MDKNSNENMEIETQPFVDLVGQDIVSFIADHAPTKVVTRFARSLDHYSRAPRLKGIDEEMGAIRLIAGEEELVVAIFEWLKLKEDQFPEHKDFVRKFKSHVVKMSFYPVLSQFRFILADMLKDGFTLEGLEGIVNWTAKPVVDGKNIRLVLFKEDGSELIRLNPLSNDISHGDVHGKEVVPLLLNDFIEHVKDQSNITPKGYLGARADFRNKLLYATDAGSIRMEQSLEELIEIFKPAYHDLLWVLAILIGSEVSSKKWGLVSQFIALYREVLILAGVLPAGNIDD